MFVRAALKVSAAVAVAVAASVGVKSIGNTAQCPLAGRRCGASRSRRGFRALLVVGSRRFGVSNGFGRSDGLGQRDTLRKEDERQEHDSLPLQRRYDATPLLAFATRS